jgi:hypothetical protein
MNEPEERIATTTITKTPKGFMIDVDIPKSPGYLPPAWFHYITPALLFLILIKPTGHKSRT